MPQGEAIPLMRRRRRCSKRPPGGEGGGRGITVNIVHPGSTTTDMNPANGEQARRNARARLSSATARPTTSLLWSRLLPVPKPARSMAPVSPLTVASTPDELLAAATSALVAAALRTQLPRSRLAGCAARYARKVC